MLSSGWWKPSVYRALTETTAAPFVSLMTLSQTNTDFDLDNQDLGALYHALPSLLIKSSLWNPFVPQTLKYIFGAYWNYYTTIMVLDPTLNFAKVVEDVIAKPTTLIYAFNGYENTLITTFLSRKLFLRFHNLYSRLCGGIFPKYMITNASGNKVARETMVSQLVKAFLTVFSAKLITYPFITLQERLSMQANRSYADWKYVTSFDAFYKILRDEGLGGIFGGIQYLALVSVCESVLGIFLANIYERSNESK
jgi:hypothetical protein